MIYPDNFEYKLGFDSIRQWLKQKCLSTLGKSEVDMMKFTTDYQQIVKWMNEIREMKHIKSLDDNFPLSNIYDIREELKRIKIEGAYLEEGELLALKQSLVTVSDLVEYLNQANDNKILIQDTEEYTKIWKYPALHTLTNNIITFPKIIQQIDQILDKYGHIKDSASRELYVIRQELSNTESSVSRLLNTILQKAQQDGIVEKGITPTLRDGRLVIPIMPSMKRKISGIIHDESATGKTVFVEPSQVVEVNNKIRELKHKERQEIVKILSLMTSHIRPYIAEILRSLKFLGEVDLVHTKALVAIEMNACEPVINNCPYVDFVQARHPLLERHLPHGNIIPLDIILTPQKSVLIISGPNAGGKSVCLKTVGLLQYMLQCGLSIPLSERSVCGIFHNIMIDIGDEQSLDNDLSTYSSHLLNMKNMMRSASDNTLILIDEFGTGTEPQLGGAIAQSVLDQFVRQHTYAVITTHYQNLKQYANSHPTVSNGAMLYDRNEMKPLFQLVIGRPGSSFAIDIARKIGLPENVITNATELVGSDYIQSDKYLQDIVRDKRYWAQKRQTVRLKEKQLQQEIEKYEKAISNVESQRKAIMEKAKSDALTLLNQSNKVIENVIKTIKESQADKEATKLVRGELLAFKEDIKQSDNSKNYASGLLTEEEFQKKIQQIKARKQRQQDHKNKRKEEERKAADVIRNNVMAKKDALTAEELKEGMTVGIRGTTSRGIIESIDKKYALIRIGDLKTKVPLQKLNVNDSTNENVKGHRQNISKIEALKSILETNKVSRITQKIVEEHKQNYKQDLDVRGMRGDEALQAVQYFIDDAILMGATRVRILHGKGNGILRQLIRQYLSAEKCVQNFADERIQLGGPGITVVDL